MQSPNTGRSLRVCQLVCLMWICAGLLGVRDALAWVYPEHRSIALLALQGLDEPRRRTLDQMWGAIRRGREARLCAEAGANAQGELPSCIDYAAWPAIAGDHSCSSQQMVDSILASDWILDVAGVTARLRQRLATAGSRSVAANALRDSDIELQRADPDYATRAGSNTVHFLLARPGVGTTAAGYAAMALTEGVDINALAAYAWYHIEALEKARALSSPGLPLGERAALSLAVLADEAFALHFLEDVFAAGHVAGSWGDVALRKGTHDYYNEHGLAVTTWNGDRAVLTGDAWMRPTDAERAARSARRSLEQVLDAAVGTGSPALFRVPRTPGTAPGGFDVCLTNTVPARPHDTRQLLAEVLLDTPVPMLVSGLGEMPRFRTELGPFLGVQAAARGASLSGGFGQSQREVGAMGGLELGSRAGFGLDGVMNESGDGLVFLDLGIRLDGSSSNRFGGGASIPEAGAITAAIPSRFAYAARLRLPFWLLPGDLLLAGPILLLASPSTLSSMAVVAGNGGLIPWQAGIATPIGRFQFILGREVGASIFGLTAQDPVIVPSSDEGAPAEYALVEISSIQLDFPVLEYRPFRAFSSDQSTSLVIQLFGGVDIPFQSDVVAPVGIEEPDLKSVWHFGLRLSFDWRYYL